MGNTMKIFMRLAMILSVMGTVLAVPVLADLNGVVVEKAWSRASVGTSRPGVAYMDIRNMGEESVVLTGLRADVSAMPTVHKTSTDDRGVSSMVPAGEIEIAAGEILRLEPGGLHAMLMKLRSPLVEGEEFDLTLIFSGDIEMTVVVPVLGIAARGPEG